jgi:deoxyadenosine/deoxycytidine kinase
MQSDADAVVPKGVLIHRHCPSPRRVVHRFDFEGNIGAGKSTALDAVARMLNRVKAMSLRALEVVVVKEPVEKWGAHLEAFYRKEIDAKSFQYLALTTRANVEMEGLQALIKQADGNDSAIKEKGRKEGLPPVLILLVERAIDADPFTFAHINIPDPREMDVYRDVWKTVHEQRRMFYDAFNVDCKRHVLLIDAPVEMLLDRICKRSRDGENKITIEYLQQLKDAHALYERHLEHGFHQQGCDESILYRVDGSGSPLVTQENILHHISRCLWGEEGITTDSTETTPVKETPYRIKKKKTS